MQNIQEYIDSGILELYVYGALTEKESAEVTRTLRQYPEIREEVEQIENVLLDLSSAAAPYDPLLLLTSIKVKLYPKKENKEKKKSNWLLISGWAASIALLVGLFFMYKTNTDLRQEIQALENEKVQMENSIANARQDAEKTRELLEVLRSRNIERIVLPGQEIAPQAYAIAYWDSEKDVAYIDAKNLPEPPPGMVYQVWSLELDPLTPRSIGLLENYEEDDNLIFRMENQYPTEAFGITLEPAGGSETPTLERLYVLGQVS